jgi:NitT/TauT family transport system substrate-binding protein
MKLFTRKTPAFLSWTLFKGKISLIHRKIWTVRHNFLPLAIASCLGVSLLVSCSKTVAPPLRVGTNLWPGYETLHLAKNLGYYKDTSIELVDLPSGTEQVRAFRNGNIDAAGISLDQALTLATTNPNVRIISIMDFSEGGDVILAKPDIPNLKALKGKRVGVEANALGAYIITRALEKAGMTTQDIQVVSLGLSEHERAFKDGKIDAVVTFGPARNKILSTGAKEVFNSSDIPGEIVDVLIVKETAITEQSDTVKALVKGRFQALDYLTKNPQDAASRIAPRTNITPEQFLDSMKGLRSPDLQQNRSLLSKSDPTLLKATQRLVEVMVENKLLSKAIDPAPLFDDRILNQVQP